MTVEELGAAIDALAETQVVGHSQRDEIVALWRERARLDAQLARRVAEFDTSVEWSVDGSRSAASWLVRNLRLATGEAHHHVRVARQMVEMPIASAAWREGRISSRHVDVLTSVRRAADAETEFAAFEQYLVNVALTHTPEDVAVVGRRWRDALDDHLGRDGSDPKKKKDAEHERRGANFSRTLNGIGILDGTFDPEGAEIIDTALTRCYERNHQADDPRTPAQQGVPLDLGRATRTCTPDQYRAIMIRDGGCRIPGCDIGPEGCQAHHIQYRENGGRTDLNVGIAVCRGAGHHRLIHEGDWTITGDPNGKITFHDPDGKTRGSTRPRKPPDPILTRARRDITRAKHRALELAA